VLLLLLLHVFLVFESIFKELDYLICQLYDFDVVLWCLRDLALRQIGSHHYTAKGRVISVFRVEQNP